MPTVLNVFPFKVGDIISHKYNTDPTCKNLEIIGVVPCGPPFVKTEHCETCGSKLVFRFAKDKGYQDSGCWCIWNTGEVVWEKVAELKKYVVEEPPKLKESWDESILHNIELSDGDVLLVRIPPTMKSKECEQLRISLGSFFKGKGWLDRNITWAVITSDIGLQVLKVPKGESKEEAVQKVCTNLRLIRVG